MVRIFIIVYSLFVVGVIASPPSTIKQYRSDYVYNSTTDSFYKLHVEPRNKSESVKVCEREGASLMFPNQLDKMQLYEMMKLYPDIGNFVRVSDDGQEHESAEEPIIIDLKNDPPSENCDVVTREGYIEVIPCSRPLPFICKVKAKNAPYDRNCDVYSTGYKMLTNVNSCYKIPRFPLSWNEAFSECKAEGAHLVILNSWAEHYEVFSLIHSEPKVEGSKAWYYYFAGFRADVAPAGEARVFRTIFNQTLEEAGYAVWADHEPNNAKNNENCGTIFWNDGKLNDLFCEDSCGFICEKEIQHLNN